MEQEPKAPESGATPPAEGIALDPAALPDPPATTSEPVVAAPAPPVTPSPAAELFPTGAAPPAPAVEPGRFVFTQDESPTVTEVPWNGAAPGPATVAEADPAAANDEPEADEPAEPAEAAGTAGPNLMLAIVCWVASATSLFEAYNFYAHRLVNTYAFVGYLALGLGVLFFSLEALLWARPRRPWMAWIFAPATLLTLVGVIYLTLSHAPGRRI